MAHSEETIREILGRLESAGSNLISIYDDVERIPCPVCGFSRMEVHRAYGHIIFECLTPVENMCDESPFCIGPCGFKYIVNPVKVSSLPPFPVDRKAPTKRRRRTKGDVEPGSSTT